MPAAGPGQSPLQPSHQQAHQQQQQRPQYAYYPSQYAHSQAYTQPESQSQLSYGQQLAYLHRPPAHVSPPPDASAFSSPLIPTTRAPYHTQPIDASLTPSTSPMWTRFMPSSASTSQPQPVAPSTAQTLAPAATITPPVHIPAHAPADSSVERSTPAVQDVNIPARLLGSLQTLVLLLEKQNAKLDKTAERLKSLDERFDEFKADTVKCFDSIDKLVQTTNTKLETFAESTSKTLQVDISRSIAQDIESIRTETTQLRQAASIMTSENLSGKLELLQTSQERLMETMTSSAMTSTQRADELVEKLRNHQLDILHRVTEQIRTVNATIGTSAHGTNQLIHQYVEQEEARRQVAAAAAAAAVAQPRSIGLERLPSTQMSNRSAAALLSGTQEDLQFVMPTPPMSQVPSRASQHWTASASFSGLTSQAALGAGSTTLASQQNAPRADEPSTSANENLLQAVDLESSAAQVRQSGGHVPADTTELRQASPVKATRAANSLDDNPQVLSPRRRYNQVINTAPEQIPMPSFSPLKEFKRSHSSSAPPTSFGKRRKIDLDKSDSDEDAHIVAGPADQATDLPADRPRAKRSRQGSEWQRTMQESTRAAETVNDSPETIAEGTAKLDHLQRSKRPMPRKEGALTRSKS